MKIEVRAPSAAEFDIIHAELTQAYWSPGIPREVAARAFAHSVVALAFAEDGALMGFARLVTDRATFAWVSDVVTRAPFRGQGVARALVAALRAEPELQGLRRWLLATRDAHRVYAALGFTPLAAPERMMEIKAAAPYGEAAG